MTAYVSILMNQDTGLREVLLREMEVGLRQLSSSAGEVGSRGGPMSPRLRTLPNRPPLDARSSEPADGTNLLPFAQTSSVSAGPEAPPS